MYHVTWEFGAPHVIQAVRNPKQKVLLTTLTYPQARDLQHLLEHAANLSNGLRLYKARYSHDPEKIIDKVI